jgi:Derlin-2/3
MDQVMDGGRLPLETWFWEMPVVTRWWTVATLSTSALVQCQMITPLQLFYSFRAVFVKSQVSRKLCFWDNVCASKLTLRRSTGDS